MAGTPVIFSFSSIGHDPARAPSAEFIRSTRETGAHVLFVTDNSRSWAGSPDFAPALLAARQALETRHPPGRILALGLSMGGFCALAAAQVLRLDAILAFGPQFSIDPAIVPDPRWRAWTDRIPCPDPRICPLPPGPWRIMMHGMRDDAAQAQAFPQMAGLDHILFPDLGHSDLVPHLKTRGGLQGLISAALAGDRRRLLRIASRSGGQRRQEPR